MSDVLDSSTEIEELEPSVTAPEHEPSRFTYCDAQLFDSRNAFFNTGRRSFDFGIQFGIFRKALGVVELTPEEDTIYSPWREMSKSQVVDLSRRRMPLESERIRQLEDADDPAVHVISVLESFRRANPQELGPDIDTIQKAEAAYDLLLAGIHGIDPS